jgi:hypothetical protein
VDPKLFVTDPNQTFRRVSEPDPTLKSFGSGFGFDPNIY